MSTALEEFQRRQTMAQQKVAGALAEAQAGVTPEQAAQRVKTARRYGVSPDVAGAIPPVDHVTEVTEAIGRAPRVGEWIKGSGDRAALARGGFKNLADTAQHIETAKPARGFFDKALDFVRQTVGLEGADGGNYLRDDVTWGNTGRALGAGTLDIVSNASGVAQMFGETALGRTGPLLGMRLAADAISLGFTGETFGGSARRHRETYERYAESIAPKATTEAGEAVMGGIRSLPMSATALVGGAYVQSAKLAAALMGTLAGGGSYGRGRDAGLSQEQATLYGTLDAVVEAGTELLPFQALLPGTGAGFVRRLTQSLASDIPGEQIATFLQDLNQFVMIDQPAGKTYDEFLAERGSAAFDTLVASVIGSGSLTTAVSSAEFAARKLGRNVAQTTQVEETERFNRALADLARASTVLQRDPESFEEFVAAAADQVDGPTEVFVEASELQNVLNQSDLTVEQVFEATGKTPEELQQLAERGEDIAIPIEQYASRIATQTFNEQLMPHLRLDPDDFSRAQAETFMQEAQEQFQRDAEAQLELQQKGDERAASRARVEERILGELNNTRRFTESTNRVYASLVGAFFDTQSAKVGQTAEQLAETYGLRVQAGAVAQPTFDQNIEPLPGAPRVDGGGPIPDLQEVAARYAASIGQEFQRQQTYAEIDPDFSRRVAEAYEAMPHDPTNPEVREAYENLIAQTRAQYDALVEAGYEFYFFDETTDPYGGNPWGAMRDLRENKRMGVFATEAGFGTQEEFNPDGNPLLADTGLTWDFNGQPKRVLANDLFRAVHDAFGHGLEGAGFRARGEENAWQAHSRLFTGSALGALTSETRGQNSWLNFGPYGERNRNASVEDTVFADQKTGLMPSWTWEERVFDQSAAELQTLPLQVRPTGNGGRVLNRDLGEALTLRHRAQYGRALDPTDPGDYQIALQSLLEDYENQKAQPDTGEAWYSDDIAEALEITQRILPELEVPVRRDIFLTAVALLSPQQGPVDNWANAIDAMTGYSITGRFALEKPSGQQFGVASHRSGLRLFQHLIDTKGEIGALVWLNDEHTGREMEAIRRESGIFQNKANKYLPKEMNLTESKQGVYIFGPKVGDFMLNSTGLDQSAVTVDLWMARTYNRVIGRLMDVNAKQAADGALADAMRGKSERAIVKQLVRDAAQQAGITPSAMQAALWYFEQRLYRNHGIRSESTSFSDAARAAAETRGISLDGPAPEGRATRSDEAPSADLDEGVRVYFQDGLNPLDTFKRESYYPTRATRHADGTVYADIPNWYPDRQARVAEEIGATAVVAVEASDPRLDEGVPLWHTRPPLNPDGTIRLDHWGSKGITSTDPLRWGESGTLPASERGAITSGLPRTYFGIASGQPGGYIIEFPNRTQYSANVPADRLYDIQNDPDGFKPAESVPALERKIKDAGYLGYWTQDQQLGLVATVFEPLDVQPAGAQVYAQDAVFFSALERAIEKTATTKASAQQWEATLRKTPGVKQEELEWTGLLEFLQMQDGPITREQLLEVVRGAGIRVDEVVLGGPVGNEAILSDPDAFEAEVQRRIQGDEDLRQEAEEAIYEERDPSRETQFATWTTDPSNDTYRELLITLPVGEGRNPNRAPSTHWDNTDGVIAHARFMDKTDADGKKVLFIEEVQSDWHQKGRDEGYAVPFDAAAADAAQERRDAAYDRFIAARNAWAAFPGDQANTTNPDFMAAQDEKDAAELAWVEATRDYKNLTRTDGIPNAPFRTDWPALVLKRMIRWAAEHGYERIAWTTGEQQAARYNLSTATGRIGFTAAGGGKYWVSIDNQSAWSTIIEQVGQAPYTAEQLSQVFGRDIAQRGVTAADESGKVFPGVSLAGRTYGPDHANAGVVLEGEDLRVGGEGMKAFYDRNLVNITNKLVKKYGAKVGPVQVKGLQQETEDTEYTAIERRMQGIVSQLRAASALGGKARLQERIDALREVVPGHPDYREEAAEGYAASIRSMEAALPLYDEFEQLGEQLSAMQKEGRSRIRYEGAQPGFDITPELADAAMGGFPLFQRERQPRGQIAFAPDITQAPSVITLLRGADLSTFVHELGHFFFEVTNDMANRAGAPAELVADRDAMLRYLGVESVTEWENRTPAQRREGHERLARSFEAYLFEGRAPSLELRGVFAKLRSWMMNVYRTIRQLNVELTDEVRGVFDRMLASQEAIAEAEADAELRPLFAEKPEGMTDADWEEYQRLNGDATEEAAKALEARSLRDMRYASNAVNREIKRLQRQVKEQRDAMREEVEAELSEQPVYRAMQLFRTGQLDGETVEGEHKLNTEEVREALQLGDAPLPDALRGMTKKGGLHPQQAAELFGFTSADHLLKELMFASPLRDAVEAETDSRMRERYGDLNSPEEVEEAARAAVHNEVRARFVATELAALQKAPGKKRVLAAAARRMADDMVARLRIRDLRPSQYEAAERRAARAAQKAGTTDIDEAVRQKRNQLLQFNLAKAAHEAREETKNARDYLTKFNNKNTRANIDPSFLDQIDQLLERYELREVSNIEADRRKSLADWIAKMQEQGFEPAIDPETLAEIGRKPWRELTVEEMRGLRDAVRNIEHLGRLTKKLLTAKDKADLDTAAGEMADAVRANASRTVEPIVGAKTWWELVKGGVNDFFVMHRKIANMVHVFDGNQYGGVFWERFIRPMNERGDWQAVRNREANLRLAELFRPLLSENTTRREYEPAIGKSISLEDRLMVALNMGNEANLQRLMDGDMWTHEQVMAVVRPLQGHHWDFVENVWREIDSFWPEIADKERRVSGVAPEKVEPLPFQVEVDGQLRLIPGGYFPIKYDPDRSSKAEADEAAEVLRQMTRGLYTNSQTRRGHTKERVAEVRGRPLRKDFGVIFGHVNQVIHDLAWHEYLIDANRLLRHGAIDSAIRDHYGPETLRWMRKALEDIAIGDIPAQNAFERSINHLRNGVSITAMGWSVWTSLLQPVGLTQSMARIGTRHVMRGVGDLFRSPAKMNEKLAWVREVSPFMRERADTMQREINEIRNQIGPRSPMRKAVDRVVPSGVSAVVTDSYFYMLAKAQLMADLPTWLGQYHKSMEAGEPHDRAVAIADQAVIDSQGAGQIKDLAGIQRGSPLLKLFTNFYSYFSATYNLMSDRTQQLRRVGARDLPYFIVDMALLTFLPATITSLMYSLLREGEDDEEELLKNVAADNAAYMLGLMIGAREIGSVFAGVSGYQGPAGARFFAEVGRLGKQVEQGEVDEALLRATNSTAGILLHYPASQLDRTVRGVIAFSEGDAGPEAVLMGPPVGQ